MIKKIILTSALLVNATSVYPANQHDYIGFGWISPSTSETISGISVDGTGFGFGFAVEKHVSDNSYIGFGLLTTDMTYDISNTASYIDGDLSTTGIYFGTEIALEGGNSLDITLTHSSGSGDFTLRQVSGPDVSVSSDVSGMSIGIDMLIPLSQNRLSFGISKGISGDYSDNDMSMSVGIRFNSTPELFTDFSYSFSSDANVLSGVIGLYF